MEDSFFGFDTTSIPLDDDGGGGRIAEPSEEEYDALNDETFGSALNGDWEEAHESLVRLTDNFNSDSLEDDNGEKNMFSSAASSDVSTPGVATIKADRRRDPIADSDLELNLSNMKLDDVDICFNDAGENMIGAGAIKLDPSVWSAYPIKADIISSLVDGRKGNDSLFLSENSSDGMNSNHRGVLMRDDFTGSYIQRQLQHQILPQATKIDMMGRLGTNSIFGLAQLPKSTVAPKICTLEDIERNLIIQQAILKEQQQSTITTPPSEHSQMQEQQQQAFPPNDVLKHNIKVLTPIPQQHHSNQFHQNSLQKHQQQSIQKGGPPGFSGVPPQQPPAMVRTANNFNNNNLAQHPLGSLIQQQQSSSNAGASRMPPGFPLIPPGLSTHSQLPPHPLLNQPGLTTHFVHAHTHSRPLPNPHLPIALNNFAMHPNFNAMRATAVAAGIHPVALIPPHPQLPQQQPRLSSQHGASTVPLLNNQQHSSNSMFNVFNMRLMQEIQQNHPLLQNNSRHQQLNSTVSQTNLQHHHNQQQQQRLTGGKQNTNRGGGGLGNGNLPADEFDEYANLMSTRDKHWLIGIQLSQLNTDTPYIDDYYYTVYRERKAVVNGNMPNSQAHKDNQLNHPLTQPKGHAQLILVQLGNKNGSRNGQNREHRISESGGAGGIGGNNHISGDQKTPYVFTPLKFENSLGKLQFGSVTAPRKIIDADIMSGESLLAASAATGGGYDNKTNLSMTIMNTSCKSSAMPSFSAPPTANTIGDGVANTQRKSRHILLHIETLYRIVLKLEDLNNPNAIATIIMKKKKEIERITALEQLDNVIKSSEESTTAAATTSQSLNPALKNKFAYEIESKDVLVEKLIQGLTYDKVLAMMNVRKGKALIKRIMPHIEDKDIHWNVWISIFASLQNVIKKDRDDAEGMLYALYPEFKRQIKTAPFDVIVKIAESISYSDKKSSGAVFCSRFGISSLVYLILRAEEIYVTTGNSSYCSDSTLNDASCTENWRKFLNLVAISLNQTIENQTISAAIESDSIQPMMNHFARFNDLNLDSLLALITEAKQQID